MSLSNTHSLRRTMLAAAVLTAGATAGFAQSSGNVKPSDLTGRWSATLEYDKTTVPFRLDISTEGSQIVGKLFDGDEPSERTTSAAIDGSNIQLNFEHYLTRITAKLTNGELDGALVVHRRSAINITPGAAEKTVKDASSAFHAVRYVPPSAADTAAAPNIAGEWELPYDSSKGEKAWRLIVKQSGANISASVLRVDGDTGSLTGAWKDGHFVASHFDGSRPGVIDIKPNQDGTLHVSLRAVPREVEFTAYRPEAARAKGLAEPANYQTHTTVRDPNEVFTYAFPNVDGTVESNEDAKFKDKVVLAIVTGTWCPNCHDEAKYLVELYKTYHARGLEIVALDFEEADQLESKTRVRAFITQYGVPYTYLLAGTPDQMWEKIPQAVNLNTWPATLFIGRDGRVKATYSGFASAASGSYNAQLKEHWVSLIEGLLNNAPVNTAHTDVPVAGLSDRE